MVVECGAYIGFVAKESGTNKSVKMIWTFGLVYGLFFGLLLLGPLFLTGYLLALSMASLVALLSARLARQMGPRYAAVLAGLNSGLTAFGVIMLWLHIWPFPH